MLSEENQHIISDVWTFRPIFLSNTTTFHPGCHRFSCIGREWESNWSVYISRLLSRTVAFYEYQNHFMYFVYFFPILFSLTVSWLTPIMIHAGTSLGVHYCVGIIGRLVWWQRMMTAAEGIIRMFIIGMVILLLSCFLFLFYFLFLFLFSLWIIYHLQY